MSFRWNEYLQNPGRVLDIPVAEYLRQPETALVLFVVCAAISMFALWKVFRGFSKSDTGFSQSDTGFRQSDTGLSQSDNAEADGLQKCAWAMDKIQPHKGLVRWVCASCGGFSFGKGRDKPTTCRQYEPKQKI